jgi:hypothetical protein
MNMINCTIAEARNAKRRIEDAILMALNEFSKETGLLVKHVALEYRPESFLHDGKRLLRVSLDVGIPP